MRCCEQMQDGVGRSTHRNIKRHRVFKGRKIRDVTRQNRRIVILVIALRKTNNRSTCFQEEPLTIMMGCKHRAIARQCQA